MKRTWTRWWSVSRDSKSCLGWYELGTVEPDQLLLAPTDRQFDAPPRYSCELAESWLFRVLKVIHWTVHVIISISVSRHSSIFFLYARSMFTDRIHTPPVAGYVAGANLSAQGVAPVNRMRPLCSWKRSHVSCRSMQCISKLYHNSS